MNDLESIISSYIKRLEYVARAAPEAVSHAVIERTPVLSGSLVMSWSPSVNTVQRSMSNYPLPDAAADPLGTWNNPRTDTYFSQAKLKASRSAVRMALGDTYYLVNSQPYARVIEYDGVSYRKAPQGMRDVGIAQWQGVVDKAARDSRNGS